MARVTMDVVGRLEKGTFFIHNNEVWIVHQDQLIANPDPGYLIRCINADTEKIRFYDLNCLVEI